MICNICPHKCGIDRSQTLGWCQAPEGFVVNTAMLHYGEEPILSGSAGSGTIFFSHCNMSCVYCQNYRISSLGAGMDYSDERFIEAIHDLKSKGAININLVNPSHYSHRLIPLLERLKKEGCYIPIVWNSNAYENVETLKMLEGLVDIYLPDFRYWDDGVAYEYSGIKNYRTTAQAAIGEMLRQTGNLSIDEDGIAIFGTLIRLLVLPNYTSEAINILRWLHSSFGNEIHLSLLSQYYPTHKASNYPKINTGLTYTEYQSVVNEMEKLGFENGFIQELAQTPEWTPKFNK